ncbi:MULTISPECIES: hypothetical protein [Streptomyces]|uniref:hypothetical protein n=1 Tax=Streptomyces TaxID=1883 RepID=UPI0035DE3F7A
METRTTGVYRERAERRRRTRGTGEARGDGWQRTEEDEQLLRLATRYSTLTLHQAAYACWGGRIEAARRRVRLMAEAGLLHRSADVRWARTIVWPTERGARIAGTGLGAPRPPGERLLHRLAVADAGIRLESEGHTVLSEREVHAAEAVPGRAAELLADLGVHQVPAGARRGETLAVPVGARAVHWPDLVVVLPGGRLAAFEVELTAKPAAALRTILRTYKQTRRPVAYLATEPVVRQLQGGPGPGGRWIDGVAQELDLLPPGGPDPGAGGHLRVRPFTAVDPAVARRAELQAARLRGG